MVTKRKKATALTCLCANVETEEFERFNIFVRKNVKTQKTAEKIARSEAENRGLNFIKVDYESVTLKYTMEDEEFFANAKEEVE